MGLLQESGASRHTPTSQIPGTSEGMRVFESGHACLIPSLLPLNTILENVPPGSFDKTTQLLLNLLSPRKSQILQEGSGRYISLAYGLRKAELSCYIPGMSYQVSGQPKSTGNSHKWSMKGWPSSGCHYLCWSKAVSEDKSPMMPVRRTNQHNTEQSASFWVPENTSSAGSFKNKNKKGGRRGKK